jgi:type IV secretion system protein VirB6
MCLREKIGPDPRNFNQRVSLGRNDLLIRTFLTILFSALSLRIVVTYLNLVLDKATRVADNSAIVELGAQVCLAGVCAAILVYISAKLAAALAGASATVSMQGLAAGIGAAAFGAGKLAGGATQTTRSIRDNIQGWKDASAGKSPHRRRCRLQRIESA